MFYWMSRAKQGTAASGQSGALNDRIYVPALLVLVNKTTDTGLALEFNIASRGLRESRRMAASPQRRGVERPSRFWR